MPAFLSSAQCVSDTGMGCRDVGGCAMLRRWAFASAGRRSRQRVKAADLEIISPSSMAVIMRQSVAIAVITHISNRKRRVFELSRPNRYRGYNAWRSIRLSMLVLATWDIRSQNRRLKGVVVAVKQANLKWMLQVGEGAGEVKSYI